MIVLSRRKVVAGALAAAVGVTVPVAIAAEGGGGTPANKAVAAGSTVETIGANQTVTLLSATMKTSKPTDLLMSVSLECSLFTRLLTNNDNPSSVSNASVVAWLEMDGAIVPISSTSTPPQDGAEPPAGGEQDKVTFCDREYSRTVTDQEDPADGIDQEDDYIRTKAAHAFNWVKLNAGSGMHTVELKAEILATASAEDFAEAKVGNRTLVIEPTKMANNAEIAENGTSGSGR